eukprot:jgi/Tetstr1/428794/TSEL_018781.t1
MNLPAPGDAHWRVQHDAIADAFRDHCVHDLGIAVRREVDYLFQQAVPLGNTVPRDELKDLVPDAELSPPAFNVVTGSYDPRSLKSTLLEFKTMRYGVKYTSVPRATAVDRFERSLLGDIQRGLAARDAAWHNTDPGQKGPLRDILDMSEYTGMVFGTMGEVQAAPPRERAPHSATSACQLLPGRDEASSDSRYVVKARMSWLKAAEVATLLRLGFSGSLVQSGAPAQLPTGGSLYLYDRRRVRHFRADGHNWRKKLDGSAVRETHEKLKVENIDTLNCYYARAMEPAGLQRRCYWLLEDDSLVLVHYLTAGGRAGTSRESSDRGVPADGRWQDALQLLTSASVLGTAQQDKQRRRSHDEDFGDFDDLLQVERRAQSYSSTRPSLEAPPRGRHSSLEEDRDSFILPGENWTGNRQTAQRWSRAAALPRSMQMPQPALEAMDTQPLLPWESYPTATHPVPALNPAPCQLASQQLYGGLMDAVAMAPQQEYAPPNGRPSMEDTTMAEHPEPFQVVDVSRNVVGAHGGDKVLVVGTIYSNCDLRNGVYVEVDGVRCSARQINPGVISFITEPHHPGIARVMISDSFGHVMSSSVRLQFV